MLLLREVQAQEQYAAFRSSPAVQPRMKPCSIWPASSFDAQFATVSSLSDLKRGSSGSVGFDKSASLKMTLNWSKAHSQYSRDGVFCRQPSTKRWRCPSTSEL